MDSFLLRRTGAECIRVFFLVLAACGSVMIGQLTGAYGHMGMAFSPGLVVMVAATGHLSMAHLNPAVTLAFALTKHFPWREVPYYIAGQLIAAALGAAVLRLLFGNVSTLGANLPSGPVMQSLVMEVLVTVILMFVIVAAATDKRALGLPAGLAIGGAVALNVLWAGPISGAFLRAGPDIRRVDVPLDLLGWPDHRGGSGRVCLRVRASLRAAGDISLTRVHFDGPQFCIACDCLRGGETLAAPSAPIGAIRANRPGTKAGPLSKRQSIS